MLNLLPLRLNYNKIGNYMSNFRMLGVESLGKRDVIITRVHRQVVLCLILNGVRNDFLIRIREF
jgi:hypothetical protein